MPNAKTALVQHYKTCNLFDNILSAGDEIRG